MSNVRHATSWSTDLVFPDHSNNTATFHAVKNWGIGLQTNVLYFKQEESPILPYEVLQRIIFLSAPLAPNWFWADALYVPMRMITVMDAI